MIETDVAKREYLLKREISHPAPVLTGGALSVGPLSDLVSVQLRRVDVLLTRGFAIVSEGMKMRSGMISCLGLIAANPGISQKEIALQTGSDKSIIASLVGELEQRGWAKRHRSKIDHRRYQLNVTAEGEMRLRQFTQHIREVENALLADISVEELEGLTALLHRMHNSCMVAIKKIDNS